MEVGGRMKLSFRRGGNLQEDPPSYRKGTAAEPQVAPMHHKQTPSHVAFCCFPDSAAEVSAQLKA